MRGARNNCVGGGRVRRVCGVVLLLLACGGFSVGAQTVTGRISGTVKDATGSVVPGAAVTVTNAANNLARTATTDEDGFYTMTNLPAGTYAVLAEREGFKKALQSEVSLVADARL